MTSIAYQPAKWRLWETSREMPRGPNKFKQRDVTRALKGARAAGYAVARVEIEDNRIIVVPVRGDEAVTLNDTENEWDDH
jgi:hypothetical protein